MEESILKSTKKILGLDETYTPFDLDVITHINGSFSILSQLGVGPEGGFSIIDDTTEWSDYLVPADQLHLIKTYIYLKVRVLFDPPGTSFALGAANDQIKEYEWRLNCFREVELPPQIQRRWFMIQGLEELMTTKNVVHLSEQPWSNYTKADYSIEQWHSACLIHIHDGPPTSKAQCKLPVKTPNGALNRNGVHAAAAALAGARGGINASSDQKAAASRALARYYSQLGEEPPDSLKHGEIVDFISHYGTRGMKWGVRKQRPSRVTKPSGDAKKAAELKIRPASTLTNKQLKTINERMNLEQNYNRMNPTTYRKGKSHVTEVLAAGGLGIGLYKMVTSDAAKWLRDEGQRILRKKASKKLTKEITKGASFHSNII